MTSSLYFLVLQCKTSQNNKVNESTGQWASNLRQGTRDLGINRAWAVSLEIPWGESTAARLVTLWEAFQSLQKRCSNLLFQSDLCNSVTCSIQKNIKRQRCQTRIGSSHCCHWEKICDPSTCHRSLRAPRTSALGRAWNQSAPFVQTARSLLRNDMKISHPLIILIIPPQKKTNHPDIQLPLKGPKDV